MPADTNTDTEQPQGAWARIVALALQALPAIASAIGVVTFVALIGGAIQWVRFWAAGLPADQAVRAVPKQELVVIGAVSLAGFLLAGLLAVLLAYLVDRQAEAATPTLRSIVGLTVAEMGVTLFFVDLDWWEYVLLAVWFVAMGLVAARTLAGLPSLLDRRAARTRLSAARTRVEQATDDLEDAQRRLKLTPPGPATHMTADALQDSAIEQFRAEREWLRARDRWAELANDEELPRDTPPSEGELERHIASVDAGGRVSFVDRFRPAAGLVAVIAAGTLPLALSNSVRWLLIVLGVVALLGAVSFLIARVTPRFAWYGLAVLASVILFGATLSITRTVRAPKVQPLALVRVSDKEPICGVYIAQTDDRVYVGRVEPKPGSDRARTGKGRMFWVREGDVDVVSVGPLQKISTARARAPELAAELALDRAAKAAAAPKPVVKTTVIKRTRRGRESTVTKVTEIPRLVAAPDPGEPQPRSCDPPQP